MGRTAMVNHRRGHFQDPARQLTSSASGRAILQDPRVRAPAVSPIIKRVAYVAVQFWRGRSKNMNKPIPLDRTATAIAQPYRRTFMTTMFMFFDISVVVVVALLCFVALMMTWPLLFGAVLISERQVGIVVKRWGSR